MVISAALLVAVATGFRAVFLRGAGAAAPLYKDWVTEIESTTLIENITVPGSVGTMKEWKGERKAKGLGISEIELRNKDYENTLYVPVNVAKDTAKLGIWDTAFEQMGINAQTHPDVLLKETLVAGFTKKSYDGLAFFSASHTSGGNLETGALTAEKYATAMAMLLAQADDDGTPLRLSASPGAKRKLMVGPSIYGTAKSIVECPTITGGGPNPWYQTAEVVLNEHLIGTYATYWFLGYSGGNYRPLVFVNREKPSVVVQDDPKSDAIVKRKQIEAFAQSRCIMGLLFHQAMVGSTGA